MTRYTCPSCGKATQPFVFASKYVQVNDDGEVINENPDEDLGTYFFDATDQAICDQCGHRATLAYFRYGQDPKKLLASLWQPYRFELEDSITMIAEANLAQRVIGISNLSVKRFGEETRCMCCNTKLIEGIGAHVKTEDDEVHAVGICRNRADCLVRRGALASIDGGYGLYEAALSVRNNGQSDPALSNLLRDIGMDDIREKCRFLGNAPDTNDGEEDNA